MHDKIFGVVLVLAGVLSAPGAQAGDLVNGEKLAKRCLPCHSLTTQDKKLGPSLQGIVGRKVASVAGYKYSPAMVTYGAAALTWDATSLDGFLADPKATVPGTKMALPPVKDPAQRADIITYLESLKAP